MPTPFQPLANPPTCIVALYTKSAASIESNCFLQLCKTMMTPLPTQITPDVWILITPPSAPSDAISLICPEKPMTTIPVRQPLHILNLPTACSATSSHFYLPPRYESPVLNINVSLDMANLQTVNITALHYTFGNTWGRTTMKPSYNTLQTYHQYQYTRYMNTFWIIPYTWHPSIWSCWEISTLCGICSPTQQYTFQL